MTIIKLVEMADNITVGDVLQIWKGNKIVDYLTIDRLFVWVTYKVSKCKVLKFHLYDNNDFENIHRVWIE